MDNNCKRIFTNNEGMIVYNTLETISVGSGVMSDSLHTIIPSINSYDKRILLNHVEFLLNDAYPIAIESYDIFESKEKMYISFHLKDYGIRDIRSIGYTLSVCFNDKIITFEPTYSGVTYFDRNDFFIDVIDMDVFERGSIKSAQLDVNYIMFYHETSKHLIGSPFDDISDENKNRFKTIDKRLHTQTSRISATGSEHKAEFKEKYIASAYKVYDEVSVAFAVLRKAAKRLIAMNSELSESSFIAREEKGECINIPIKCHFDKDFYCALHAAQNCQVISKGVSEGGTLQYNIAVNRKSINLLMLLYYLTISHKGYFTYMSKEQVELQEYLNMAHPAQMLSLQLSELTRNYSNYAIVTQSPIYTEALVARDSYFDFLAELRENIYSRMTRFGQINRWTSEYKLFFHVKAFFNDAIYQYAADWLGLQTLDIFVPSVSCGIEYQGRQHYEPIDFFGSDQSFLERISNDEKKKDKCISHNVRLLEWNYETPIRMYTVKKFIEDAGLLPAEDKDQYINNTLTCDISSTLELINDAPSYRQERRKARPRKVSEKASPIDVIRRYDKNGKFNMEYSSITEAAFDSGISAKSIQKSIYSLRKISGGYIWRKCEKDSSPENIQPFERMVNTGLPKSVIQIDTMGEIIARYVSIGQAAKITGINRRSISDALTGIQNTAGGFCWRFADNGTDT